jgi:hypothetical protein
MAVHLIKTLPQVPLYDITITLDGKRFVLLVDYNGRRDRWYCSLSTLSGTLLRAGEKVATNMPLFPELAHTDRPLGELVPYSEAGGNAPGWAEFGPDRRVQLVYYDLAEILK